ncbi:MAG: RpiB/LacA/LacB family sugar-phosphate isomerase, partial [Actinobacteria bacterium]|nr:RpiB/LacA/LacB family sugar-phosphate isomerase [Actinomycetota bacterium]
MKIHLGCDHAGFELKEKIVIHLKNYGHEVIDHGAKTYDALDDYPVFCFLAAQAAAK